MAENGVVVEREVALHTDYFTAFHDRRGVWTVTHSTHVLHGHNTADWVLWFDGHARDNHRHVFWCEERYGLRCADEQEAESILKQLESEFRQWLHFSGKSGS